MVAKSITVEFCFVSVQSKVNRRLLDTKVIQTYVIIITDIL